MSTTSEWINFITWGDGSTTGRIYDTSSNEYTTYVDSREHKGPIFYMDEFIEEKEFKV
jgi:hypothetical protein